VAQLTLAAIITSATAALTQSLIALERVELGYRPDSVFVARLSLPPQRYRAPTDIARFLSEMEHTLAGAPGVLAAGATSSAPLSGILSSVPFAPAQRAPALKRDWPFATFRAITPGYLSAIGARVIAGRAVSRGDDAAAPPMAVVNRALAARYFPSGAIDRELLVDDNNVGPRPVRIVGIVDDLREVDLDGPATPQIWIAAAQAHPDFATFMSGNQFWAVRVRGDAGGFAPHFLRVLRDIDPTIATAAITDLRRYVDVALSPRRFSVMLLSAFASIALLLTTLGIYAVTAYSVEQRRREIGVRIALGATPRDVVQLVLSRTLRVATVGIVLGLIGAYLGNGVLAHMMFGVSLSSPPLLAAVAGFLIVTTLVASTVPGLRAARIDPRRALSTD